VNVGIGPFAEPKVRASQEDIHDDTTGQAYDYNRDGRLFEILEEAIYFNLLSKIDRL
jgi:hypothetical protein